MKDSTSFFHCCCLPLWQFLNYFFRNSFSVSNCLSVHSFHVFFLSFFLSTKYFGCCCCCCVVIIFCRPVIHPAWAGLFQNSGIYRWKLGLRKFPNLRHSIATCCFYEDEDGARPSSTRWCRRHPLCCDHPTPTPHIVCVREHTHHWHPQEARVKLLKRGQAVFYISVCVNVCAWVSSVLVYV